MRCKYKVRLSELQEFVLANTPGMVYSLCFFFTGIFLLDTTQKQFAFSLLPQEAHECWTLKFVAAMMEFWFVLLLIATSHFYAVHNITFIRTVQTSLAEATEALK